MINDAMFSSNTNEWATPQAFFDELNKEFDFTLDPCATPQNAKCARYFTKEIDGLAQSWRGEVVFCNPPYGRDISKWVAKAYAETLSGGAKLVVLLIPATTGGGQSTTAGAVKKRARRRDKNLYNLTVEIPRDVAERVFAPAALRKLGYLSKSDFVRQAVAALDAKLSTIESKEKTADAGTSDGE